MASGYGAASMDQIASKAGVSKQTVYSHFGAKDALFEEIISSKCESLLGADGMHLAPDENPEKMLFESARAFLKVVLHQESITLYRTILAECGRFPELAQAFYRAGPKRASERLAEYLGKMVARGTLQMDDPRAAAGLFFAMLRGDLYLQCILALRETPSDEEVAAEARMVSAAFMRAYRVPASGD